MNSSATSLDDRIPLAKRITRSVKRAFRMVGLDVARARPDNSFRLDNPDISDFEWETWSDAEPYTAITAEGIVTVIRAVEHIINSGVPGDVVECGVWRGGTAMAVCRSFKQFGDSHRRLFLYDTFEGMTQPTDVDVYCDGRSATEMLADSPRSATERNTWVYAPIDMARSNILRTGISPERVEFVRGPVEHTLPTIAPERIALILLATEWYESTLHELRHLYPRLSAGGILVTADYGIWEGARRAVNEFFGGSRPFLTRVDTAMRVAVKPR